MRRLPRIAMGTALALVAAEAAAHLLDFGIWHLRVGLLDADTEDGLFPWVGCVLTGLAGCGAALRAAAPSPRRLEAAALAAIFAFLAVGSRLDLRAAVPHWAFLYAPLLVVAAYLLWTLLPDPEARVVARAGLVVLAVSLAIHELGPPVLAQLGWGPAAWAYQVKIAIKEGSELAGWLLVALALLSGAAPARQDQLDELLA